MPSVLVTGASRGLGRALARAYAARGWRVFATIRERAAMPNLEASCPGIEVHAVDMRSHASMLTLAQSLAGVPLDVLLLNAGVSARARSLQELSAADLIQAMQVNAVGPLLLTQSLLPNLLLGSRRVIVAMSSELATGPAIERSARGYRLRGSHYAYRVSKAALNMCIRLLALELADRHVVSVAIDPGWIRTDMGGADADLDVDAAASSVIDRIERLSENDSGMLLRTDGTTIPW